MNQRNPKSGVQGVVPGTLNQRTIGTAIAQSSMVGVATVRGARITCETKGVKDVTNSEPMVEWSGQIHHV